MWHFLENFYAPNINVRRCFSSFQYRFGLINRLEHFALIFTNAGENAVAFTFTVHVRFTQTSI